MAPLSGVRVLAFEQYGAGPFGTQYLADFGAEVIKVEQTGTTGDYVRELGPYYVGGRKVDSASSLFFQALNRNKKSICLNIESETGRQVFTRLVESADAIANNLRGDVPEKLGLTYDAIKSFNPAIVCAHCSAYGRTGPRKNWPGFDFLMQAEAGYFQMCGEPDTPPTRFGLSVVDFMAGLSMSFGLVSSILQARQSGQGCDVDVTLFDTALNNLSYLGVWALNEDYQPTRISRSAHPTVVPCQLYKTADGWIYLMCNKSHFWPTLCQLMERPELAADERFKSLPDRLAHRDLITDLFDGILGERTTEQWMQVFQGRIPAAPVLSPAQALRSSFVQDHHRVQTLTDASGRDFQVLRQPIRLSEPSGKTQQARTDRAAPLLGEHTDQVLLGLGYSADELEQFRQAGVISTQA